MPNKDVSPLPTGNREDDLLTLSAEVLDTLLRPYYRQEYILGDA